MMFCPPTVHPPFLQFLFQQIIRCSLIRSSFSTVLLTMRTGRFRKEKLPSFIGRKAQYYKKTIGKCDKILPNSSITHSQMVWDIWSEETHLRLLYIHCTYCNQHNQRLSGDQISEFTKLIN
jgi:hypothetical protein